MSLAVRASSLILAAALALPALADDPVMVATPVAAEPAVIETAQLDPAVVESATALELFGLSSAGSTALVFVLLAIVVTVASSDGDPQGIPP